MEKLSEYIRNRDVLRNMKALVVTAGTAAGFRMLVEDGICIWESQKAEEGWRRRILNAVNAFQGTGNIVLEDCRLFSEELKGGAQLIICGGGHVSAALVKMAKLVGLKVTVLEDRPLFANQVRQAGADQVICDAFEQGLTQIEGDRNTYFVVVTRGHRHDKVCLQSIFQKPYAYVGMMGSKSRVRLLKEVLAKEGIAKERLSQLHAPIGLNILSETPEEIAVSILGEIIQVKNAEIYSEGYSPKLLQAMAESGKKVLATIISRKGSAPRKIGTKMLILEDGSGIGTIGGGCAEAEVMSRALYMLRQKSAKPQLFSVNMTNQDAGEEGMVCGGIQELFLEVL